MKQIVKLLQANNKTIATMESCTGGGVANAITNIPGASEVLRFSAVTYSNEYKIKMGVNKETIDTYTVYSEEVAKEMSYNIAKYASSSYGVGITGKINRQDPNNLNGEDNVVYISIYDNDLNTYHTNKIILPNLERDKCKKIIIKEVETILKDILV